jgi:hypothetical protein
MATPTLQEVLHHVVGRIDTFNELIPGVAADKKNLMALMDYIDNHGMSIEKDDTIIHLEKTTFTKKKVIMHKLYVAVCILKPKHIRVIQKEFPWTDGGLVDAIMEVKKAVTKIRRGFCPECDERPYKRFKVEGMDLCGHCVMKTAVGL